MADQLIAQTGRRAAIGAGRKELEHGDLPPYDVLRKLFAAFGIDAMARDGFASPATATHSRHHLCTHWGATDRESQTGCASTES